MVKGNFSTSNNNGVISIPIEDIKLGPPNIKIKAERQYEVEKGLTADEQREYLIGYEGASLTSDTIVKITTEWFNTDGTPLPTGLSGLGFTGRLAKVTGPNSLSAESGGSGNLAQFSLKPGHNVELVKLGGDVAEHYYVQVSPQKPSGNPDFSSTGQHTGVLKYRPDHYVPIKVPLLDETLSWKQFRAYQKLKAAGEADDIPKPKPIYKWYYRPEMQFSMYDLEIDNIFRDDGDGQSVDIYPSDTPVISSSDDVVRIAYSLLENAAAALDYLGVGQTLIFAIGEHEIEAEVGPSKQINFTNLEHLSALSPEDFLSMRLYRNNDPGNILWEYAFNQGFILPSHPDEQQEYIAISSDRAGEGPV
ncbi:MAG: hypothetical protein MJK04_33105, partial [Psychrosphaera sp.]|nr:hypothetical protein [Psychrosphaera sp.]